MVWKDRLSLVGGSPKCRGGGLLSLSFPNKCELSGLAGWLAYRGGNTKEPGEASCQTDSPSLFVSGPRAAGKCLSQHTLVLSLRKSNLEVTSRSNCTSVEFQIPKGVKELSGCLSTECLMDQIQASHGPKKLSGCLGNAELIWTIHSRLFACLLWIWGQLELLGGLPR